MKYELKITVDTENVDFLTKTLAKYCHDCVKNDVFCFLLTIVILIQNLNAPFLTKDALK